MIPPVVSIIAAVRKQDYVIQLSFDDGTSRVVDFGPFLQRSQNPDIRRWLDHAAFASYRIEHGDLVWGDWELCFPIADLYAGSVS